MESLKLLDEHGLAVVSVSDDQQVGHPVSPRMSQQFIQLVQDLLSPGISDPSCPTHPTDALGIA
jgi:hypothetical protein